MKVAVCMSGHMRSYKRTADSWNRFVFDKYSPDVFIHSWNYVNWKDTTDVIDPADVQATFNPTKLVVEDYDIAKKEWERILADIGTYQMLLPDWRWCAIYAEIPMYRKVYLSHALIDSSYDLVIQARPDLLINADIVEIALRALETDDTTFLVKAPHPSDNSITDHPSSIVPEMSIGRQPTIKYLSEIFPNLDMLLQEAQRTNQPKLVLNAHLVLYEWMRRGGFDYTYLPSFDTFTILR
jgi:hypothetical protein